MSRLLRLAAATVLVAAAGLTVPAPAYAEACSSASGVTVVVDFHELGGGIEQSCVPDQGTADDLFVAAGHTLQNVNNQAFVCRVDGLPTQEQESCARTPPAHAYWGLWWSDGENGTWTYASQGAYSFDVPDGGAVALSWNGSSTKSPPGAPPPTHASEEPSQEPEPSNEPTTRPSQPPTSGGGGTGGTEGGSPSSASPSSSSAAPDSEQRRGRRVEPDGQQADRERRDERDRDRAREDATTEPSGASAETAPADTSTTAEPPVAGEDPALPVWVGPTAVGGVLGLAGLATYLRRRAH